LIQAFDLKRVSKSPAVFNLQKLNWMNSQYLKNASVKRLMPLALPYLQQAGFVAGSLLPKG
jgi:nondiscriminating glutamyl-tRNA synthetase